MSRIGKEPVVVPEKVKIAIEGSAVSVKGPKGSLDFTFTNLVKIEEKEKHIHVTPVDESLSARMQWGTTRTVIANMVHGVTKGFVRELEFNGVGYKAAVNKDVLELSLGFSHPINFKLPEGIAAKVAKNQIELSGYDKQLLGQVAAKVRSFRPPEPYKGKGIKYKEEVIIRKAGKSGGK